MTAPNQKLGQVVCFGECMIELARASDGKSQIGFGGDTLNTAVYLSRLGISTSYMTALGNDAWSAGLKAAWLDENLDTSLCLEHPTRCVGIYAISTDTAGERSFVYWRDQSAARGFFDCDDADLAFDTASDARMLYLSGISLAIFTPSQRRRVALLARRVRENGGQVAFDPNYRPRLWSSVEAFRSAIIELAPAISIVLPSFDDEVAVWGDIDPKATLQRWCSLGVQEVVVKHGAKGALTQSGWVRTQSIPSPLDTTGAGDSFNAGYLAARLGDCDILHAGDTGARLSACVVQITGAVIPSQHMPSLRVRR